MCLPLYPHGTFSLCPPPDRNTFLERSSTFYVCYASPTPLPFLFTRLQMWQSSPISLRGYPRNSADATYLDVALQQFGAEAPVAAPSAPSGAGAEGTSPSAWHAVVRKRPLSTLRRLSSYAYSSHGDSGVDSPQVGVCLYQ